MNTLVSVLYYNQHVICPQAPSLGSQGTQDSGLDSVHLQSPERGRRSGHRAHRERRPPVNGGYWVYSPHPHAHGKRGKCHSFFLQHNHGDEYHVKALISVHMFPQMLRCSETVEERAIWRGHVSRLHLALLDLLYRMAPLFPPVHLSTVTLYLACPLAQVQSSVGRLLMEPDWCSDFLPAILLFLWCPVGRCTVMCQDIRTWWEILISIIILF